MEAVDEGERKHREWRKLRDQAWDEGLSVDLEFPDFDAFNLRRGIAENVVGTLGLDYQLLPRHKQCRHARELERRRIDLKREKGVEKADQALREAKQIYHSLLEEDFRGTFPYKRLCIIYRNRDRDLEKEEKVARMALSEYVDRTEKQTEWFESRIERSQELQQQSGN